MTRSSSDARPGGVPAELLRAGVYVPETGTDLADAVRAVRAEEKPVQALRSRLADSPALLDDAVRRLARMAGGRDAEAVLVADADDLLLAAPVARKCGLPLRQAPGGSDADGGVQGRSPPAGERGIGISAMHDARSAQEETMTAYRRAGGKPLGWLALAAAGPQEAEGDRWSAVSIPGTPDTD